MALDMQKLDAFMGKFVGDLGATFGAGMVVIGESLGLYKALAGQQWTADQLAAATATDARYVREWLSAQAAAGYVEYDKASRRFSMTDEQAFALANADGPAYIPGAFELVLAALKAVPRMIDNFKSGAGMGWHEHDHGLFHGTERFFRPGYAAHLVQDWIPALTGVGARLEQGARVADVGCGHGASTILLAQAYPRSRFIGFDYHAPSIDAARGAAREAGVADRAQFDVASAKDYPGRDYDLVAFFDCLHDMGDPVGAASHVRQSLKDDGCWMIVEPFANDRLEDNLNPVGRVYYGASTLICTPASRSQEVALCLGAQAGEARLREVVGDGGFMRFRRATETPFNLVFEAQP
ncbi:MAG: class I SAM-dependent methyltransferase [Betaproteobacteria bacterium]